MPIKKAQSWTRLQTAAWCKQASIASMNDPSAKFQKLSDGYGSVVKDEYAVTMATMPANLTPEAFLAKFARSPNTAVTSRTFNAMNVFTKRTPGRIAIGDIYDIDIAGPDNGSIVLVAVSPGFGMQTGDSWFAINTISCDKTGTHPECGAREFGFEYTAGGARFYTRGVSKPANRLYKAGAAAQKTSWMGLMDGVRTALVAAGGLWDKKPIHSERA